MGSILIRATNMAPTPPSLYLCYFNSYSSFLPPTVILLIATPQGLFSWLFLSLSLFLALSHTHTRAHREKHTWSNLHGHSAALTWVRTPKWSGLCSFLKAVLPNMRLPNKLIAILGAGGGWKQHLIEAIKWKYGRLICQNKLSPETRMATW